MAFDHGTSLFGNAGISMAGEEPDVEITVRTVDPVRPYRVRVPAEVKIDDLKKLVASDRSLPIERLKLVLHGKPLHERRNGDCDDVHVRLQNGDSLMVVVMPEAPAKHLCDYDDIDDDELKFHIPQSATWWKRKLFYLLRERLRLPDMVLFAIFSQPATFSIDQRCKKIQYRFSAKNRRGKLFNYLIFITSISCLMK